MDIRNLPDVDRIQGLLYRRSPDRDPKKGVVNLQYTSSTGELCQMDIPSMDALYLLNMLEALVKDEGIEHLRHGKH